MFLGAKTRSMDVWTMSFRSLKKKSTYDGPKLEDIEDTNVPPRLQKQLGYYFAGIEAEFSQVCQENEQCKFKCYNNLWNNLVCNMFCNLRLKL